MPAHDRFALICGRVLFSLIFLISGINHLLHFSAGSAALAAKGFPLPTVSMAIAIALLLAGGICVISSYHVRFGAALLALFLIVATPVFHDFWTYQGAEAEQQQIHFLKNVAMLGGALAIFVAARHAHAARSPGS